MAGTRSVPVIFLLMTYGQLALAAVTVRNAQSQSASAGAPKLLINAEQDAVTLVHKVESKIKHMTHGGTSPEDEGEEGNAAGGSGMSRIILQILFGILYYFMIVSKYPLLEAGKTVPEAAAKLQEENALSATMHTSVPNCLFSWCCTGPRAAHTFDKTGVLNYWVGLIAMSCVPCCTLFAMNSFTELNERLGGQKAGIVQSCLCAFCCSCCVVAQDAETLDLMTGSRTTFIGVENAPESLPNNNV